MSDHDALVDLGRYLRTQRELARLSLRAVARMTNVSGSYLSQIERGLFQPSPDVLVALAEGLGIAPSALFRRVGWLEEETAADGSSVRSAIHADPLLDNDEKAALLATYNAMVNGK